MTTGCDKTTVNQAEYKWSGHVKKVQSAWCQSFSHTVLLQAHCAADQKQQPFWPKPGSVLATTPAAVRPVSSLLLFPSLAEWWRLIVLSEKAKPVRAFSSLISQVQSSSLWAGNYIWREKDWLVATERSNGRSFSKADNRSEVTKHSHLPASYVHSTMLVCRCNITVL